MTLNFTPLHDRIVLQQCKEEEIPEKSKNLIILPDTVNPNKHIEGVILAVGEGLRDSKGNRVPVGVKVGDRVIYDRFRAIEIKLENETYLIFREADIFGLVESE